MALARRIDDVVQHRRLDKAIKANWNYLTAIIKTVSESNTLMTLLNSSKPHAENFIFDGLLLYLHTFLYLTPNFKELPQR